MQMHPPAKIGDYALDKSISKPTGVLYHNPISGDTKVVYTGTRNLGDWVNNAAYVTGLYKHTNRYKKGKKLQQRAEAKYGTENTDTIGHSQSGILARDLGR